MAVPSLNDKLLWDLLNDLYPVRAKWKVIGLGLGAKNSDLDTITGSHTECLQSILTEWLKGINPYPSWNTLLNVLKAPVVDEAKLAAELEEKIYHASNSQVAVDDASSTNSEYGLWLESEVSYDDDESYHSRPSLKYGLKKIHNPEVRRKLKQMDYKFRHIIKEVQQHLSCTITNDDKLNAFKAEVTVLPASEDGQQRVLSPDDCREIISATNTTPVIIVLNQYWSCFDYKLLEYIVEIYGNPILKKEMKAYVDDMDKLEEEIDLSEVQNIPLCFPCPDSVIVECRLAGTQHPLCHARRVQYSFAKKARLHPYAVRTYQGRPGSIVLTIIIPHSVMFQALVSLCGSSPAPDLLSKPLEERIIYSMDEDETEALIESSHMEIEPLLMTEKFPWIKNVKRWIQELGENQTGSVQESERENNEDSVRDLKRGRQGIRDVQAVNVVGENCQVGRREEEREEGENNAADDEVGDHRGVQNIGAGVDDVRELERVGVPLEIGAERRENVVGENEAEREPVRAEHGPDERENVIEEDARQREAATGEEPRPEIGAAIRAGPRADVTEPRAEIGVEPIADIRPDIKAGPRAEIGAEPRVEIRAEIGAGKREMKQRTGQRVLQQRTRKSDEKQTVGQKKERVAQQKTRRLLYQWTPKLKQHEQSHKVVFPLIVLVVLGVAILYWSTSSEQPSAEGRDFEQNLCKERLGECKKELQTRENEKKGCSAKLQKEETEGLKCYTILETEKKYYQKKLKTQENECKKLQKERDGYQKTLETRENEYKKLQKERDDCQDKLQKEQKFKENNNPSANSIKGEVMIIGSITPPPKYWIQRQDVLAQIPSSLFKEDFEVLRDLGVSDQADNLQALLAFYNKPSTYRVASVQVSRPGMELSRSHVLQQIEFFLTRYKTSSTSTALLHYYGNSRRNTGDWCFGDKCITFRDIAHLYMNHSHGHFLTIITDCHSSGQWVSECTEFLGEQGVKLCGNSVREKGILLKVSASCRTGEHAAELLYTTRAMEPREDVYYFRTKQLSKHQQTYSVDFRNLKDC